MYVTRISHYITLYHVIYSYSLRYYPWFHANAVGLATVDTGIRIYICIRLQTKAVAESSTEFIFLLLCALLRYFSHFYRSLRCCYWLIPYFQKMIFLTSLPIPTSLVIFHLTAQDCNKQKFTEL